MRVLFTTQPMASHFHLLVPLAQAVREAGYDTAFATAPAFCEIVRDLGFEAMPVGPNWEEDADLSRISQEHKQRLGAEHPGWVLSNLFVKTAARKTAPDLLRGVKDWRPDVMVSEAIEFASWIVSEQAGIPRAVAYYGFVSRHLIQAMASAELAGLRQFAGLAPDPELKSFDEYLQLVFAPPSYPPPDGPAEPTTHLIRPMPFDRSRNEELPDWFATLPDRPTVYSTFGTVFGNTPGVFEAILDGLADEAVNVVATVGRDRDPAPLAGRAKNARIEPYIPQSLVLPHCDAVISHSGYGTVMGALTAGVPMVLIPVGADQFFHEARCRQLGVSVLVEHDAVTPKAIRNALRTIRDDPSYRSRAQEIAAEIETLPAMNHGVTLLERLASSRAPVVVEGSSTAQAV